MKLSVSLSDEDVSYLDTYAREQGYASRSAVLHQAVRLLRAAELGDEYEAAWREWESSDDASLWESTTSDGIDS